MEFKGKATYDLFLALFSTKSVKTTRIPLPRIWPKSPTRKAGLLPLRPKSRTRRYRPISAGICPVMPSGFEAGLSWTDLCNFNEHGSLKSPKMKPHAFCGISREKFTVYSIILANQHPKASFNTELRLYLPALVKWQTVNENLN